MTREPWRYVCPGCGSTQLEKRVKFGKGAGLTARSPYYCNHCKSPVHQRMDKKTGELEA